MSEEIYPIPSPRGPDPELEPDDPAADDAAGEFLRERMLAAVSSIEARPGTLEYLRAAVPARRKRRQAVLATTAVTGLIVAGTVAVAVARPGGGHMGTQTASTSGSGLGSTPVGSSPGMNAASSGQVLPRGTGPAHHPIPAYSSTLSMSMGPHGTTAVPIPIPPPLVDIAGLTGATPYCQNSSMGPVVFTPGPDSNGVSYETVTATAQTACGISGPPVLTVVDSSGAAAAVPVYREDGVAAPGLASVAGWGRQVALNTGDKFMFQFAWVPTACPVSGSPSPSSSADPPPTPTDASTSDTATPDSPSSSDTGAVPSTGGSPGLSAPSTSAPSQLPYTVNFSVYGTAPLETVGFTAPCGAAIYTTDIYLPGEYPGPHGVAPVAPAIPNVPVSTS